MNPETLPTAPNALRQHIRRCMEREHLAAAEEALNALLAQVPNDTAALIDLADVMFRQGQFRASNRPLLHAARHLPYDAPLIFTLAEHLVARGEIVVARACLDLLTQAPEPPPELLCAQASLRFSLGEIATALALMEHAVQGGIDTPTELHMYAMLLQFSGRIDETCAVLERCLARWPSFADAAMVLINLRKQRPDTQRLPWLEQQLQRLPPVNAEMDGDQVFVRAEFEYACFKTLDDLERRDEAWNALARCNALMHRLNPYDASSEEAVTSALIGMSTVTSSELPRAGDFSGPTPIFIVGMPRSGTTLLDRMLSSHSQVASAGELIEFWRQLHWVADVPPALSKGLIKVIARSENIDYRELGERYLKQTQWRAQGRAFYVDKLPANIQMIAFIRRALPHAPILHMTRAPMDTCFSNFKAMFGNVSPYSYDLEALAHYYELYARQVRHWHATFPGAMLDVSYAALVQDPATTLANVFAHCGLDMEEACLRPERNEAPIATPSSAQVRESIHTRGIEQWRSYAAQLEPLRHALKL